MRFLVPLAAVFGLVLLAYLGVGLAGLHTLFGVVLPYVAIAVFIVGVVMKVLKWGKSPVPFRIPTTCGQQKSLDWIKSNPIENPSTGFGAFIRMALEVLFFRSLLRNTKTEVHAGGKLSYGTSELLWICSLLFHYGFLVVVIRHMRFFFEPVPGVLSALESVDSFLQIGSPPILITGILLLVGLSYLLLRRLFSPQLRYFSLAADYFPVLLILAIACTGILLRHFVRADIVGVKELAMGLATFSPVAPEGVHWLFYCHLLLVTTLLIYFPFSKLMHMAGVFLSPTRNLANNNRAVRHINPWNAPVKVHTYEEYEDDFRERMKEAGIPVEQE
jgi:nitrate reductase gamma subunit